MKIKRIKIEDIEAQFVTGLVVSVDFIKRVHRKLKPQHFKSIYGGVVAGWCYDYFEKYSQSPGQDILRIFKMRKSELEPDAARLVSVYLEHLSSDYERQSRYNVDYLYDKVIDYVRRRDLELLVGRLSQELEMGREKRASQELVDFQVIHKETSGVFDPFSESYISEAANDMGEKGILTLPGALGELIGPLDRSWLVSFTAPEKRGKTWWLIEMAFQAISQGLNVLFVSLEMSERDIRERLWRRMTAGLKPNETRRYRTLVPVLDCVRNQMGDCEKFDLRKTDERLLDDEFRLPTFNEACKKRRGYKPCAVCADDKNSDYEATFWYERVRVNEYNKKLLLKKAGSIVSKSEMGKLRVKCFPAFTANLEDVKAVVDELEVDENLLEDVLITDYLDILGAPSGNNYSERGNIDSTWKGAKGLAQVKNLLHITVDQSSKVTYERDIRLSDTSEDKRKNAHVDVKVSMNFFDAKFEDDVQVLRFSLLAHRHRSSRPGSQVIVLQQNGIGQPLIDCAWLGGYGRRAKKNKD